MVMGKLVFDIKKIIRVIGVALLICLGKNAQATWQVYARNTVSPDQNTQLFLLSSSSLTQAVKVHLGVKYAGQKAFYYQDHFELKPQEALLWRRSYHLPVGKYELHISTTDSMAHFVSISYEVRSHQAAVFISDIFLDKNAFLPNELPQQHFPQISAKQDQLFFRADVQSTKYSLLTARAVLYIQNEQLTAAEAQVFTSIQQQNNVLNLRRGVATFTGSFALEKLEAGSYLIEIIIYEDDQLVADQSVNFEIQWKGYALLREKPLQAIQMLSPML